MKNFYVIVGPAGAGKKLIAEELSKRYGYPLAHIYTDRDSYSLEDNMYNCIGKDGFRRLLKTEAPLVNTLMYGKSYAMMQTQFEFCDLAVLPLAGANLLRVINTQLSKSVKIIYISAALDIRVSRLRRLHIPDAEIIDYLCIDSIVFCDIDPDHLVRTDSSESIMDITKTIHDYILFEEWRS